MKTGYQDIRARDWADRVFVMEQRHLETVIGMCPSCLGKTTVLGVEDVVFMRQPDLRLADNYETRRELCRLILTYRPEIICTHDPHTTKYMNNPDHRILARMVMEVSWPMAIAPNAFPELLEEGLLPHHVKEVWYWNAEKTELMLLPCWIRPIQRLSAIQKYLLLIQVWKTIQESL